MTLDKYGRIVRTPFNKAARKGYRTPTEKQPDPWHIGFGVFCAHATATFTLAQNKRAFAYMWGAGWLRVPE